MAMLYFGMNQAQQIQMQQMVPAMPHQLMYQANQQVMPMGQPQRHHDEGLCRNCKCRSDLTQINQLQLPMVAEQPMKSSLSPISQSARILSSNSSQGQNSATHSFAKLYQQSPNEHRVNK